MKAIIVFLIPFLIQVESGGDPKAVGDNGKAVGALQIWTICVDDVNRIVGENRYSYDDRLDSVKSVEMAEIYLTHYGMAYQRKNDCEPTWEVLAAIWNGGPTGYKKESTKSYVKKVQKEIQNGHSKD